MEVAKKAGLTPRATKHAVADASGDINKIALHLSEQKVTVKMNCSAPFYDSTEGFKKMTPAWLKQVLRQNFYQIQIHPTKHGTIRVRAMM